MTSTAISAQGTILQIATGTGGAKTVTAVAVGFPTVLTSAGHGLNNGDVVALAAFTGADAALLNGQTATVVFKTSNTFAVAIDTTGKTITTSSSTATPNTYTQVGNVKDFSGLGDGATAEIDVTNLSSQAKEFIAGLQDNGTFTCNLDSDLNDAGQAALLAAKASSLTKQFKLVLPNGKTGSFAGFVKKFGAAASGGVDKVVGSSCDIRITGLITWA